MQFRISSALRFAIPRKLFPQKIFLPILFECYEIHTNFGFCDLSFFLARRELHTLESNCEKCENDFHFSPSTNRPNYERNLLLSLTAADYNY